MSEYVSIWQQMEQAAERGEAEARTNAKYWHAPREATAKGLQERTPEFIKFVEDYRPTPEQIDEYRTNAAAWVKEYEDYNRSIGNALGKLAEQPQDIQGRDDEIQLLQAVLERPITPVALLVAEAGTGKTALMEEFVKQANSGQLGEFTPNHYMLFALRLGELSALARGELQAALATLLDRLAHLERKARIALSDPNLCFVLFIDEIHMLVTIFGPGTKIGGDVMKDMLARTPIRVTGATTRREYDSTIAVDKPLAERFKQIELKEVSSEVVVKIANNWWENVAADCPPLDANVIDYVISANKSHRPDSAEPRKTLDILEDLVSYCRRTGLSATEDVVRATFHDRFSISLGFHIDAEKVFANIKSRIYGQPAALYMWELLLHGTAFKVKHVPNKPIFTCLLTGPTGVGKTETMKAVAEALYDGEDVLRLIHMTDYQNEDDEPLFRKRLGEILRHSPNSVIVLDEIEKAAESIMQDLLVILDEGIVNFTVLNREGRPETNTASLRNSVVVCTTNAGSTVFKDDQLFNRQQGNNDSFDYVEQAQTERLMDNLRDNLVKKGVFTPEALGRFDQLIPYRGLTEATSLKIVDKIIAGVLEDLASQHGIEVELSEPVQWAADQYNCVATDVAIYIGYRRAKIDDSNSGGARRLQREVETGLFYPIVTAIRKNPDCKHFKLSVDGVSAKVDAQGSKVYSLDQEARGGVIVDAVGE